MTEHTNWFGRNKSGHAPLETIAVDKEDLRELILQIQSTTSLIEDKAAGVTKDYILTAGLREILYKCSCKYKNHLIN